MELFKLQVNKNGSEKGYPCSCLHKNCLPTEVHLLFRKNKQSRILNILLLAMVFTVGAGMLLHAPNNGNVSGNEMQQYLCCRHTTTTVTADPIYNPFALASETSTNTVDKPVESDWVISDKELGLDNENRDILQNILKVKSKLDLAGASVVNRNDVKNIFLDLDRVKLAMESYVLKNKRWPKKLEELSISPQTEITMSLSTRGRLNVALTNSDNTITLTPSSTNIPIEWFCQTSLDNYLLERGKKRLCIHSKR